MPTVLNEFIDILSGTLDNSEQIEAEKKSGKQMHPLAKHVTQDCTHIVRNIPDDWPGRYILEESYYTYPDQEMIIKPLLFYVLEKDGHVLLHSVTVPERLDPLEVVNENPDLYFEFDELKTKPTFGAAQYNYHQDTGHFTTDHFCEFAPGLTFRLTETLASGRLDVMELWTKDGHVTTPYDTPIIYIKK